MRIPQEYLAALQEAQNRLKSGDPKGAIHIGEQLLRAIPKHPGVHVVLARAFAKTGQIDQALARLRTATDLAPKESALWTEFVSMLLTAGQKGRARKVAQKAPLKGPAKKLLVTLAKGGEAPATGPKAGGADMDEIRRLQGLMQNGQPKQVHDDALGLLKQHPESSAIHNLAGVSALALGDADKAVTHFTKTLELSPEFVGAMVNLGLALIRKKEFFPAITVFSRALERDPNSKDALQNLALAYMDTNDYAQVVVHAKKLLVLSKNNTDCLKLLARALSHQKRYVEALTHIDTLDAIDGKTDDNLCLRFEALTGQDKIEEAQALAKQYSHEAPELRAAMAQLDAQLGDIDGARNDLAELIAHHPENMFAFQRYGSYAKWSADDPLLAKLEAAVDRADFKKDAAVFAYYALAKAHLDIGKDESGFLAYQKANEQQGVTYNFDFEEQLQLGIQDRWSEEAISRLQLVGDESVAPIFIVGTPRSGSTLLEHVIAAHPRVSSIGEDTFVPPYFPLQMEPVEETVYRAAREAASEVKRLSEGGILLDKFLHNFQRIGALASAFPRAKFVQTVRDPRAVALSIYTNHLIDLHAYATDLEDIARFFTIYIRYMEHWNAVLGDRIIQYEYEKVVANPEPEIRALIARLDLEWDDACLRPEAVQKRVKTLSVAQVRSSINTDSSKRWRRYENHLAPFTEIVSEVWDFDGGRPRH